MTDKNNVLKKLSKLTTIPLKNLIELYNLSFNVIQDIIYEESLQGNDVVEIDVGFGIITYNIVNNKGVFKSFVPTNIINNLNLSESKLDKLAKYNLVDLLTKRYKSFL